jgi:hypothetical protein
MFKFLMFNKLFMVKILEQTVIYFTISLKEIKRKKRRKDNVKQ